MLLSQSLQRGPSSTALPGSPWATSLYGRSTLVSDIEVVSLTRMSDLALELLHTLDLRPLEVVQNARTMEKQIASVFKQPGRSICFCFLELDKPFALVLFPVATDDFGVERHVFPQAPDIAHFVQVFPDVW